jgi:hypothetical protein
MEWLVILLINIWYIATGYREGWTWGSEERRAYLQTLGIDYHAWRLIEGLMVFILACLPGVSIWIIIGAWLEGNLVYEKVLRFTMNRSWHGEEKVFTIFGKNLWYRWWLYEVIGLIGVVILAISL